jgi:hypothetical protein
MSILTDSGRTALAVLLAAQPLHFAWGSGDPTWDVPLESFTDLAARIAETQRRQESRAATALLAEVGRRTITDYSFVLPDPAGVIDLPAGKYSVSAAATRFLYVNVQFDFVDAPDATIREFAVFTGTQVNAALPLGQRYFTPDQLVHPGALVTIEHITAVLRSPGVRETFQHVIPL